MRVFESYAIYEGSKTQFWRLATLSLFESYVILEGSKTIQNLSIICQGFESYVIYEGSKTLLNVLTATEWFESYVIYEGSKTSNENKIITDSRKGALYLSWPQKKHLSAVTGLTIMNKNSKFAI